MPVIRGGAALADSVGETAAMGSGGVGRSDGAVTRALQRADPPADALAWVLAVSGARTVDLVEPMPGGASLAMHRVTLTSANGASDRLVLRRYVRPEQTTADPSVAAHEAAVLRLVERIATPTPRLIGVDPTGEAAGVPAVLMTELLGRPEWAAGQRWMRQLVDVLVDIHDIDPGAPDGVRPFTVYVQSSYALPKWATKPAVWERAIEIFHGPVLDDDRAFIHRDFYPGNVLWHRRTVSGLVDWEAASTGPRSMDVAHCRINLLYEGLDAADIFTRTWEQRTGRTFHRWADIATIIGLLGSERRRPSAQRKRHDIETMLQQDVNGSTARRRAQNAHLRPHRTRTTRLRTAPRAGDLSRTWRPAVPAGGHPDRERWHRQDRHSGDGRLSLRQPSAAGQGASGLVLGARVLRFGTTGRV